MEVGVEDGGGGGGGRLSTPSQSTIKNENKKCGRGKEGGGWSQFGKLWQISPETHLFSGDHQGPIAPWGPPGTHCSLGTTRDPLLPGDHQG